MKTNIDFWLLLIRCLCTTNASCKWATVWKSGILCRRSSHICLPTWLCSNWYQVSCVPNRWDIWCCKRWLSKRFELSLFENFFYWIYILIFYCKIIYNFSINNFLIKLIALKIPNLSNYLLVYFNKNKFCWQQCVLHQKFQLVLYHLRSSHIWSTKKLFTNAKKDLQFTEIPELFASSPESSVLL